MIDYFETKSQPITKAMVLQAYGRVRANKGGSGVDGIHKPYGIIGRYLVLQGSKIGLIARLPLYKWHIFLLQKPYCVLCYSHCLYFYKL